MNIFRKKHSEWLKQNNFDKEKQEKLNKLMMFLDLDLKIVAPIDEDFLDMRYIIRTGRKLKSINILISKLFQEYYWKSHMIETFLNQYGSMLSGSTFGGMFESYLKVKIGELMEKQMYFELPLKNKILINYKECKNVRYCKKHHKKCDTNNKFSHYDVITFDKVEVSGPILFETPQQNFPLFDLLYKDSKSHLTMISIRSNGYFIEGDSEINRIKKYLEKYQDQAKTQLSK